jgi:hypothetical protein
MKITSKTTLKKILELPEAEKVLLNHGVPCMSCPMASFEIEKLEIGNVCKMYGIDLKKILEDLNKKD